MKLPDHYSLVKEHDKHFELHDERDGNRFQVSKKELHPAKQLHIMRLKKFAEGGEVKLDMPDKFITAEEVGQPAGKEGKTGLQQTIIDHPWLAGPQGKGILGQVQDPYEAGATQTPEMSPAGVFDPNIQQTGLQPTPQGLDSAQPQQGLMQQAQPGMGPGLGSVNKLLGQQEAGINAEAKALGIQEQEKVKAYNQHMEDTKLRDELFQNNMLELQSRHDAIYNQINGGKIDTNRFWANKTTGSKIATILGVILGGIGAGAAHTENAALNQLHDEINKDIDAQKADLGRNENLLNVNYKQMGNLRDAEQMTRLQMNTALQANLQKIAAQTNNPILQARAQQQIAGLKMQAIPLQQQVAQNETQRQAMGLMRQGKLPQERAIALVIPKELQKQAYEEMGNYKNIKNQIGRVDLLLDEQAKNNSYGNRALNPIQSASLKEKAVADLFPLAKAVADERMTDADVRTMVIPYTIGLSDNASTVERKKQGFKAALANMVQKKTPILSAHGFDLKIPMAQEFKGKEGKPVK